MNVLRWINNDFNSYQHLISLYETNKDKFFETVQLELKTFFAANMSAALGAILDIIKAELNDVVFNHVDPQIETILSKNDFFTYFGKDRREDINRTTIKYQKLKPSDGKYFKSYVIKELIEGHSTDLPKMTQGVKDRIVESIYEIFVNSQIHSDTKNIYTCGQFYPAKNTIEFTIVDIGIGFRERVNKAFNSNLDSVEAIRWAMQNKNTTKQDAPGGIGLALLKEFVSCNKGKIQIVSLDGFYELNRRGERGAFFKGEFPGTIVNLQFKTNDQNNYQINGEIDINDIF